MVTSCVTCPVNDCTWGKCFIQRHYKSCPQDTCDLLDGNRLKGLPEYCRIKHKTPDKCPVLRGLQNG